MSQCRRSCPTAAAPRPETRRYPPEVHRDNQIQEIDQIGQIKISACFAPAGCLLVATLRLTQPAFPSEAFHIKLSTVSVLLEVAVEGAGSSRHPAVGIES